MSERDRFASLAQAWLQNEELMPLDRQFVIEYLLRYMRGQQIVINSLPDVYEWKFTGDNIVFTNGVFEIPVDQVLLAYYLLVFDLDATGDNIFDFHLSGNTLYVAGNFATLNGVTTENVAMVDITTGTVTAMAGLDSGGFVYSITVDSGGDVYIGGAFFISSSATKFAKWNGSSWDAITDANLTNTVWVVEAYGTDVYVGGEFTDVGDANGDYIVKYSGSAFSSLGSGSSGNYGVYSIDFDSNGDLYAAGDFSSLGGTDARNIANWNGAAWSALGDGVGDANDWAECVFVDSSDDVWATGYFDNGIKKWDGSGWGTVGGGANGVVWNVAEDSNGYIYAIGDFTTMGGKEANRVARWTGDYWQSLGTGFTARQLAIAIDSNDVVYIGGDEA